MRRHGWYGVEMRSMLMCADFGVGGYESKRKMLYLPWDMVMGNR